MNGHVRRTFEKKHRIKKTAIDLFNKYSVDKVSVDEIAEKAQVSKVTIYKYFTNKSGLYREVLKMLFDEAAAAMSAVIESNATFPEKLRLLISAKIDSLDYMKGEFVHEIMTHDRQVGNQIVNAFSARMKELMITVFEQGKKEGYVDRRIPNEIAYLYTEIFRAGLQQKSSELEAVVRDRDSFESLINVYFYGLVREKPETH